MISPYESALLVATTMTIKIALFSLLMGMVIALILTLMETSHFTPLRWFVAGFTSVFRGLPELLVIFFIYFGTTPLLYAVTGKFVQISPFILGALALSLIFASYATHTLRGALLAISEGQREAARALGMTPFSSLTRIIFPQMVKHAIPGLSNQWLVLLKDTALVSLIGVTELMRQAFVTASSTSHYFYWYLSAAAIYLVITLLSKWLTQMLSHKFSIKDNHTKEGVV
ncbi:ABC transporter permease subunit [Vibrio sp. S4M6]|uniref:ABC transporter permease n=1 Tax=Vibrio sinus TaxID=2946865 RepID=UPI002029EF1E|nr:ABC transporter permease subunit [Vibrio sinus]MCL9780726.1 ABC transporter permease subunit [Vibrio sinus]